MYIIRSGRSWDNPKIEFITEDKDIADALVLKDQQRRYAEYLRSEKAHAAYTKERVEFREYQISQGKTLDEYDLKQLKDDKKDLERRLVQLSKSFDEWKKGPFGSSYADWYYEEAPLINNLDEAVAHFNNRKPQLYGSE